MTLYHYSALVSFHQESRGHLSNQCLTRDKPLHSPTMSLGIISCKSVHVMEKMWHTHIKRFIILFNSYILSLLDVRLDLLKPLYLKTHWYNPKLHVSTLKISCISSESRMLVSCVSTQIGIYTHVLHTRLFTTSNLTFAARPKNYKKQHRSDVTQQIIEIYSQLHHTANSPLLFFFSFYTSCTVDERRSQRCFPAGGLGLGHWGVIAERVNVA